MPCLLFGIARFGNPVTPIFSPLEKFERSVSEFGCDKELF